MQRRFEILSEESVGGLPVLVRADDGAVLRLSYTSTGTPLGSLAGRPVYGCVLNAWEEERTAGIVRAGWLELDDPGDAARAPADRDPSVSGWLDEVGVRLGPERGGGLFERTATDADASVETTATAGRVVRPEFSRMAVLARVAAWHDPYEGVPVDVDSVREDAIEALRRVILEEPLDPLPVLSEPSRAWRAAPIEAAPRRLEEAPRTPRVRRATGRVGVVLLAGLAGLAAMLARC